MSDSFEIQQDKLIKAVNLIFDSFDRHQVDDLTALCALRSVMKEVEKRTGFKVAIESENDQ